MESQQENAPVPDDVLDISNKHLDQPVLEPDAPGRRDTGRHAGHAAAGRHRSPDQRTVQDTATQLSAAQSHSGGHAHATAADANAGAHAGADSGRDAHPGGRSRLRRPCRYLSRASLPDMAACAAARRATGTRNGEQET